MMMTKYQLEEFNRAFTSAVESTENHEADNVINWNFVDADVTMAMHEVFGSELDDSELEIEFNFAAEKYLSDYGHWANVA